jgi:carbonic anhydrase
MERLIGRWRAEGEEYEFRADGSFELLAQATRAAGRYRVRTDSAPFQIDIHFVHHSAPDRLGVARGIFDVSGDRLLLKVGAPDTERSMNASDYQIYARA